MSLLLRHVPTGFALYSGVSVSHINFPCDAFIRGNHVIRLQSVEGGRRNNQFAR